MARLVRPDDDDGGPVFESIAEWRAQLEREWEAMRPPEPVEVEVTDLRSCRSPTDAKGRA